MMSKHYILILITVFLSGWETTQAKILKDSISIVPQPLQLEEKEGFFKLNGNTEIYFNDERLAAQAKELANSLSKEMGRSLKVKFQSDHKKRKGIVFNLSADTLGKEGYRLIVDKHHILIDANELNGTFYAVQSLLQLLPTDHTVYREIRIPAVEIVDKPAFEWRGLMLDVGRYFYPVSYIKQYIDYMAMHKLNVFHFHLVEDHGWRIEIKKYPRLTDVGAWRSSTNFQKGDFINPAPHGGYYSHEDIKEIVAYATSKQITVVPEIELPGHVLSALVAYPHLSCTGGPFEFPVEWDIQKDIYCAGNEEVFSFLEGVLEEVAELFPGEYIHIGGDEAPKDRWEKCPKCQKRIKDLGLKDEHELQSYFIKRIAKFLQGKGKRIIGWEEIIEGGLAPGAALMSWRGEYRGIDAARLGHQVVMTPRDYVYLDYFQGEPYHEPSAFGNHLPLRKVYSLAPIPESLEPQYHHLIMGMQANVWTTYIHSTDNLEYMSYPRAAALAEVAWSVKERRSWDDFKRRMEKQYLRYQKLGINYSKSAYQVYFDVSDKREEGVSIVRLATDSHHPEVYYTLDGSEPTDRSLKYTGPIEVPVRTTVQAVTFKDGKRITPVSAYTIFHFDEEENEHQ